MTYSVSWHGKLGRRLAYVSSGRVETARDQCARFGAIIRGGDCLQISRPQREGEFFCLDLLRPEPNGTKTVRLDLSSE
jgi:hypothetical protein